MLEQQNQYRDRLRGEVMTPWGVAEAQQLGIMDALRDAAGLFAGRSIAYDEVLPQEVAKCSVPEIPGPASSCCGKSDRS